MCGAALGLIGAGVSAIGQMQAAEGQAQAAEFNAKVEKINARTERQKGTVDQERIETKYQKIEGTGIANAAKSGIDPLTGSAAMVIFGEGTANRSADTSMAYVNAEGKATAHDNKAKDYEMQAKNARAAGEMSAMGSFLNGVAGAAKSGGPLMING